MHYIDVKFNISGFRAALKCARELFRPCPYNALLTYAANTTGADLPVSSSSPGSAHSEVGDVEGGGV